MTCKSSKKIGEQLNFLAKCFCISGKCFTFAGVKKNEKAMNSQKAYFYGFYFYFAANCEAEVRM
jgi:hypothetical protein